MLKILLSSGKFFAADQSTADILKNGYIGTDEDGKLRLSPEEALYLVDMRNAECTSGGKAMTFNAIASRFWKGRKFIARYFTYKDWRERGLIIKDAETKFQRAELTPAKEYPSSSISLPGYRVRGLFFKDDLITIIDDNAKGRDLYEKFWLGQFGAYKAADRGQLNKLDIYETLFLLDKRVLTIENAKRPELIRHAILMRKDFQKMYDVYRDWREKGYVIKTGFKFGTHFRVYFPGASPVRDTKGEWIHSKHVIQVFPKDSRLLTSEWARAIRVAHSVRKTFILAVPGSRDDKRVRLDYILYHRQSGTPENPDTGHPRSAMLSLSEDEYIGGREFAGAIREARARRLELIIAIADRETSVTYYRVRQIRIPGSRHEYYEIDWMQP